MVKHILLPVLIISSLLLHACSSNGDTPPAEDFRLEEVTINGVTSDSEFTDIDPTASITLIFSAAVDHNTINGNIRLTDAANTDVAFGYTLTNEGKKLLITPGSTLKSYAKYQLTIYTGIKSTAGTAIFTGKTYSIATAIDMTDKFPRIPDEELLDLVQQQTFRYFWDFGHPTSGMARERTTSGNTVTTGGTGFGVMAIVAASEREFITRQEAAERVLKIASFLQQNCTTYHGAFSHWINGETGATIPFSTKDDGADLVETALLFQGLLTARAYFDQPNATETQLRNTITGLWEAIEWTWFQKNGENVLYWHWSPVYEWEINIKITGWHEALIVYVLAASSPTYPISKTVYDAGWANNGNFRNGNTYYGITLPLGPANGGPLFFSHYSFLGINPTDLTDGYASYWDQNKAHTQINYSYCVANPKAYSGYSSDCWGLTASDGNEGYSAHSPTNDRGVIAPTAALSSMPYTPNESMNALRFFYYKLGDMLWSDYGFYDAFNLSARWVDNQHIAIDQGPIVVMIENYRSGLPWSLFMSIPEIKTGLTSLGFQSPHI